MVSFAIIAEGITDQVVIESIVRGFYRGLGYEEDVFFNMLQPLRDATDLSRQAEGCFGGWEQVLEHCGLTENLMEALDFNEYLIIHLDSDLCQHESIDINMSSPVEALVSSLRNLVIGRLGEDFYRDCGERVIFAVAVHSTECWLLSLHTKSAAEVGRVNSCYDLLSSILRRSKKSLHKNYESYKLLSAGFKRYRNITAARQASPSLALFLDSLPTNLDGLDG